VRNRPFLCRFLNVTKKRKGSFVKARDKTGGKLNQKGGAFCVLSGKGVVDEAFHEAFPGKKTGFLSHLYIKVIFLPRQARDKHRENSKNTRFLEGCTSVG
jgi:hypothetical protein